MYKPLVDWTKTRIAEARSGEALVIADLTQEALKVFAKDPGFLQQEIAPIIADQIRSVIALTRKHPSGSNNTTRAGESLTTNIQWREHTKAGWVLLTSMNRLQLREAIGERKMQIEAHSRRVLFLQALANGLKDAEQTVGERYDTEQILALRRRYEDGTAAQEGPQP
jgi:hypothetical protein